MEFGNRFNVQQWRPQDCGSLAACNGFTPFFHPMEFCFCYRHKKSDLKGRFSRSQAFTGYKTSGSWSSVTQSDTDVLWR